MSYLDREKRTGACRLYFSAISIRSWVSILTASVLLLDSLTMRFLNLLRVPLTSSPIKGLALVDNPVERTYNLEHWDARVITMGEDDIN